MAVSTTFAAGKKRRCKFGRTKSGKCRRKAKR